MQVVQEMIDRRAAYRDWTTTEDLEIEREKARAEGRVGALGVGAIETRMARPTSRSPCACARRRPAKPSSPIL